MPMVDMGRTVPSGEPPVEAVQEELARVPASPGFARNERLSQFLRYVVDRHLAGHDSEIKESVVGIEGGVPSDHPAPTRVFCWRRRTVGAENHRAEP